jgi:hypothetical protein
MSVIINGTSGISTDGGSELFGSGSIGGSLTLTSGTANGVTYLNGSKVLTSGSALTFAIFGAGSDLQIYHSGGDSLIRDEGTGNFIISTNGTAINVMGASNSEYMAQFVQNEDVRLYYDNSQKFATTSTGIAVTGVLTTTGNVGIGTSSPDTLLNIQGLNPTLLIQDSDEAGDGFIKFQTANGTQRGFIQTAMTANVMLLGTGTTERMRIDSSGNLLVGTTSSGARLSVVAAGDNTTVAVFGGSSGGTTRGLRIATGIIPGVSSNNEIAILDAQSDQGVPTMAFQTAGTERMRIDSSGNFLSANGAIYFTSAQYRSNVASSQLQFINNSAGVSLAVNGTSWGSLSDERDKEIIEPITGAVSKVSTLRSVIGRYKIDDADKRRAFLIAQDVKAVLDDEQKTLILQYTEVIDPLLGGNAHGGNPRATSNHRIINRPSKWHWKETNV